MSAKLKCAFADLLPPLSREERAALAADIKANGVLNPIIVDEDGNILDGRNRYEIDHDAPRKVIRGLSAGEKEAFVFRANFVRRNLSPDQKIETHKRMKATAAKLRAEDAKKWTQKRVAKVLGVDQTTVSLWCVKNTTNTSARNGSKPPNPRPDARVKVNAAAKRAIFAAHQQGQTQAQIAADYGISQQAVSNIVRKEAKRCQEAATPANEPSLPEGAAVQVFGSLLDVGLAGLRFGCIYADPPWQYANQQTRAATDNHYPTMTLGEICAEPVKEVAADDCHLHLWTTNGFLFEAREVMEAWGFEYRSCFVWVKPQIGIGNYWRVSHEFLLLGVRGDAKRFQVQNERSWQEYKRGRHSEKPDEIRSLVERVSSGPYLEMYGRKAVPNWVVYGNQIERQ